MTPEQIEEYWRRLAELKQRFEQFARSYIRTLEQFKVPNDNPQQQKIVVNVKNYLKVFLVLCEENRQHPKRAPSLRALNGCEKTLNAVWKRAARKRPVNGSSPRGGGEHSGGTGGGMLKRPPHSATGQMPPDPSAPPPGDAPGAQALSIPRSLGGSTSSMQSPAPIPSMGMMKKWGFLRQHQTMVAIQAGVLMVWNADPGMPAPTGAYGAAPMTGGGGLELKLTLSEAKLQRVEQSAAAPGQPSLAFQLTSPDGLSVKFEAQNSQQFQEWWPALTQLTLRPSAGNGPSPGSNQSTAMQKAEAAARAQAKAALAQGGAAPLPKAPRPCTGEGSPASGVTRSWSHNTDSSFTEPDVKRRKAETVAVVSAAATTAAGTTAVAAGVLAGGDDQSTARHPPAATATVVVDSDGGGGGVTLAGGAPVAVTAAPSLAPLDVKHEEGADATTSSPPGRGKATPPLPYLTLPPGLSSQTLPV